VPILSSDLGDGIRLLTLDNPPVNALSFALCGELFAAINAAEADPAITTVILTGSGGMFSGGADVNDLNNLKAAPEPGTITIRDVIDTIERGSKTYVAAIDGNALGGGFELALASDYRVATTSSRVGLPEIKLGLLPGAGGTQRLPRLIGANDALQMMLKGELIKAPDAKAKTLLDEVVDADAVDAAKAFAGKPRRRLAHLQAQLGVANLGLFATPFVVAQAHKMVPPEDNGGYAAHKLIDAVAAAVELPFERGSARELRLFAELLQSEPSKALRHVFFAERELGKIPGLPPSEALSIKKAAVIGGGTMGTGIAITFAEAGIPVVVVETKDAAVDKARETVFGMFKYQVDKGRLTQEEAWTRANSITFEESYDELGDVDIVVEAVFESMPVKKDVFGKLDKLTKPTCILASNTSTLDIDEIANATTRPEQVVGLHFFAPANVMALLEIVRGAKTSPETLVTSVALSKKLKKKGVISGNAFGFIGNRMLFDYAREASFLLEEGATPWQVDKAIRNFGFPMGPFAMSDLSGIDVFYKIRQEAKDPGYRQSDIGIKLYELGRYGQKTGKGYFIYEAGSRKPTRDPEVEALIEEESKRLGITRRTISDEEIVQRCMFALVNQGAELLGSGIALRPGDEDIAWVFGYGFPWYHGGPMWWADTVGTKKIYDQVVEWQKTLGKHWVPAPKLKEAAEKGGFAARPNPGVPNN
jgi:3-hydroxyacyl-CoA dehydrogenase